MSEAKHTKGTVIAKDCKVSLPDGMVLAVAQIIPSRVRDLDAEIDEAITNARRLAACWNACDGMSDEQVSHGLVSASVHSSLANQRDELLKALEELKEAVEYTPLGIRGIKGVEKAYAAISKAKAIRGDT